MLTGSYVNIFERTRASGIGPLSLRPGGSWCQLRHARLTWDVMPR